MARVRYFVSFRDSNNELKLNAAWIVYIVLGSQCKESNFQLIRNERDACKPININWTLELGPWKREREKNW